MKISIPPPIQELSKSIAANGGNAILVGGCVRDAIMNVSGPVPDYDIEVFGVKSYQELKTILEKFGPTKETGKAFEVLKLTSGDYEIDVSLPRKETKISAGHKGFSVVCDPGLTYKQAASRRDFTINSMGYDLCSQVILDPFNGRSDIKKKTLRHVGPTFDEDPSAFLAQPPSLLNVYRSKWARARIALPEDVLPVESANLLQENDGLLALGFLLEHMP